jgi:hypothetical protein
MVVHGTSLTTTNEAENEAEVVLTSTVLVIESMPITRKLPVRPATVTASCCVGTRFSRFAIPECPTVQTGMTCPDLARKTPTTLSLCLLSWRFKTVRVNLRKYQRRESNECLQYLALWWAPRAGQAARFTFAHRAR